MRCVYLTNGAALVGYDYGGGAYGCTLSDCADRTTADYELSKLGDELGPRLIKAVIRKDKPGRGSTYCERLRVEC